ncbi:hypothetical protein PVAG01_09990 [Phlyctema vagabunda]|uniref:Uncharacterized protein n=1 Tax=Phlyctema vagabunda TaxID=108571 RepID=A0ABR4P4P1_9HELO
MTHRQPESELRKFLRREVLKTQLRSPGDGSREQQIIAELKSLFGSDTSFSEAGATKLMTQQEYESLFGEPIVSEKHLTPLEKFIKRTDAIKAENEEHRPPSRPINRTLESLRADLKETLTYQPTSDRELGLMSRQRSALADEIRRAETLETLEEKSKIQKNYSDDTLPEPIRPREKAMLMNRTCRLAKSREGYNQDPKVKLKRKKAKEEFDEELAELDGEDLLHLHSIIPKHARKKPRYQGFKLEEVGTDWQDVKDMYNAASARTLGRFQAALEKEPLDGDAGNSVAKDVGKELRAHERAIKRVERKRVEQERKNEEKRRIEEEKRMEGKMGALFAKLKKGSRL